jgi:5-methylcytosine-specific restriction protein A
MPFLPKPKPRASSARAHKDKRYQSRTWRKHRDAFIRCNPLCVECGDVASVCDHIVPMRLSPHSDFYALSNHQAMCTTCHARKSSHEARTPIQYDKPQRG